MDLVTLPTPLFPPFITSSQPATFLMALGDQSKCDGIQVSTILQLTPLPPQLDPQTKRRDAEFPIQIMQLVTDRPFGRFVSFFKWPVIKFHTKARIQDGISCALWEMCNHFFCSKWREEGLAHLNLPIPPSLPTRILKPEETTDYQALPSTFIERPL